MTTTTQTQIDFLQWVLDTYSPPVIMHIDIRIIEEVLDIGAYDYARVVELNAIVDVHSEGYFYVLPTF